MSIFNKTFDDIKRRGQRAAESFSGSGSSDKQGGVQKKVDEFRENFVSQSSSSRSLQDPLFLSYGLNFNFFERIGESESLLPGLLSGSAREYLNKRGDTQRVLKLDYFTQMLRTISIDEPWYFQSLTGIDKLMEIDLTKGMRSENRKKITLSTLETIDMKMMSMIDAYRSVTIDKKYMRSVIPENLKRFDLTVYIIDPRIILKKNRSSMEIDRDSQGIITLKLYDCEFHFDSFSGFVGNLDNSDPGSTPRGHSFDISVGRIYDTYNLPTDRLYGYGGSGYSSDDSNQDYNFLSNIIRSNSVNMAEVGNERRTNYIPADRQPSVRRTDGSPTRSPKTPPNPNSLERESFRQEPAELPKSTRTRPIPDTRLDSSSLEKQSLRDIIDN